MMSRRLIARTSKPASSVAAIGAIGAIGYRFAAESLRVGLTDEQGRFAFEVSDYSANYVGTTIFENENTHEVQIECTVSYYGENLGTSQRTRRSVGEQPLMTMYLRVDTEEQVGFEWYYGIPPKVQNLVDMRRCYEVAARGLPDYDDD